MKKSIAFILCAALLFVFILSSCGGENTDRPSYTAVHTMSAPESSDDTAGDASVLSGSQSGTPTSAGGEGSGSGETVSPAPQDGSSVTEASPAGTTSKYKKSGTVHFSDSADNTYIAAVVSAYSEDSSLLAAIYTVPHGDDNTVLCFDGTLNSDGTPLRNADTLRYIYTINSDYKIKRASETASENIGYGASESKVMFYSIRHYLLPKYENELS